MRRARVRLSESHAELRKAHHKTSYQTFLDYKNISCYALRAPPTTETSSRVNPREPLKKDNLSAGDSRVRDSATDARVSLGRGGMWDVRENNTYNVQGGNSLIDFRSWLLMQLIAPSLTKRLSF